MTKITLNQARLAPIPLGYDELVARWNAICEAQREVYSYPFTFWVMSHGRFVSIDTFDEVYVGKTMADTEAFKVWRTLQ